MDLSLLLQTQEEQLLQDDVRQNAALRKRYLADHFFEIGSSGKFLYEDVDEARNYDLGTVQMQLSHFRLHPLTEDVALVTYEILNERTGVRSLRSSTWQLFDGQWKMVFHQGTIKGN